MLKHIVTFYVALVFINQNHRVSAVYDVFLGGSCNPTTWRKDIAIPLLEKINISYYNPQVDDWSPELVKIEHEAKKTSRFLLWVIDSLTRNTVSFIEIAELATIEPDRLVIVMNQYLKRQKILNEHISKEEYNELISTVSILKDIISQEKLQIFNRVTPAIEYIFKMKDKIISSGGHKHYNENGYDNALLKKMSRWQALHEENEVLPSKKYLDKLRAAKNHKYKRHLYIGVEGQDIDWLKKSAEKLLNSLGLTFYGPKTDKYDAQSFSVEIKDMQNSQIVMLIVSKHIRGMTLMTIGARLMSLHKKRMMLCVEDIPPGSIISGEKLSETSIKDYNRARTYFKDMAKRGKVPVYENCDEALRHATSFII